LAGYIADDDDEDDDEDEGSDHLSEGESTDYETDQIEGAPPIVDSDHLLKDYKLELDEFKLLNERLGDQINDFIVKYNLFDGYLLIRSGPGFPHGIAVGVFTDTLNSWARDPNTRGIRGNPLICASDAGTCLSVFC
jgi:hypothetical protein